MAASVNPVTSSDISPPSDSCMGSAEPSITSRRWKPKPVVRPFKPHCLLFFQALLQVLSPCPECSQMFSAVGLRGSTIRGTFHAITEEKHIHSRLLSIQLLLRFLWVSDESCPLLRKLRLPSSCMLRLLDVAAGTAFFCCPGLLWTPSGLRGIWCGSTVYIHPPFPPFHLM